MNGGRLEKGHSRRTRLSKVSDPHSEYDCAPSRCLAMSEGLLGYDWGVRRELEAGC